MFKVFFVDDEIVVREGIRNSIPWEQTPFTLAGEAADGEMALSLIQDIKPDILITDIRMPFMDGLELARSVRRSMPWVHVVILSGHDEFAYAREAISLGVKEYLLKPITAQELLKVLTRIGEEIETEQREQKDIDALRQQLRSAAASGVGLLMQDLIAGNISTAGAMARAEELGVSLIAKAHLVMLITANSESSDYNRFLSVVGHIKRLAESANDITQFYASIDRMVLLLHGESESELEDHAYAFAQAAKYEVERHTDCVLTVAIGSTVFRLKELPSSYATASAVMQRAGGLHGGKIRGPKDVKINLDSMLKGLSSASLDEQLRYASLEDIPEIVDRYAGMLGETALQSAMMANYIMVDAILAASRLVKASGGDPEVLFPQAAHPELWPPMKNDAKSVLTLATTILGCAIAYRDEHSGTRYGGIVRKAREYIGERYRSPDISLHTVAAHVALSNNHFCTVFSQEMGQTFIEYLTHLRIEDAKQKLLSSHLLSSEIGHSVGYGDPHYFSYIFKKHTGMSPREFRQCGGRMPGK